MPVYVKPNENKRISPAATAGVAVTMLMADNRLSVRWTHIDTYCTALIVSVFKSDLNIFFFDTVYSVHVI